MDNIYDQIMEQSRSDKIKTLGFRCYNLYIDGIMDIPEIMQTASEIKTTIEHLMVIRNDDSNVDFKKRYEDQLNEKLEGLGYLCYNLYVDNRIFNTELSILCQSIDSVNEDIAKDKYEDDCCDRMEPIPFEFKICLCGYKNRGEAKFCAKCGRKL